jgi:cytidylate kinase
MGSRKVIAIDGPAGSGKSTVARIVANRLDFTYLDTGAIYRSLAWLARQKGVAWDDGEGLARLCEEMEIGFRHEKVFVNGVDVSSEIRTEEMGRGASLVSAHPQVREALLELQRGFGARGALVAEGRDMGTVVFPDAALKIFLVASVEERAKRRWKELKERGGSPLPSLEGIESMISERDLMDKNRKTAPLTKAVDAVEIDTTGLSISQVVDRIVACAKERLSL